MKKKVLGVFIAVVLILQSFLCCQVFAADSYQELNLTNINISAYRCTAVKSNGIITITPGFNTSTKQNASHPYITCTFSSSPISTTTYPYAVIEYSKTDTMEKTMRFRPSSVNSTTYIPFNSNADGEKHRAIFKIPAGNLTYFEFYPYHTQDANSLKNNPFTIYSIKFYAENPLTDAEIAGNAAIDAQAYQDTENKYGTLPEATIEQNPDFSYLDNLLSEELLTNSSFETGISSWSGLSATIAHQSQNGMGANNSNGYAKVSGRSYYYSGIKQGIASALNSQGAGLYRFSAYIKNDEGASSTYNNYAVSIFVNGKDVGRYKYHITDEWQQINGIINLSWDSLNSSNTYIRVASAVTGDTQDFYVDDISLKKVDYEEIPVTHNAYIEPDADGTFSPNKLITRAETVKIVSNLLGNYNETVSYPDTNYTDIAQHEASNYIAYVNQEINLNTLAGFTDTAFNPDTAITKAEFKTIIDQVADSGKQITIAAGAENENITKAQAIVLINGVKGRYPTRFSHSGAKVTQFTDVNEFLPEYDHIVEAATSHTAIVINTGAEYIEAWDLSAENYDNLYAAKVMNDVDVSAENLKNEILTASDNITVSGTTYYVSNNGSDSNNGMSAETAWKTLSKVNSFEFNLGDAVLFERGGLWRGAIIYCQNGVTYGAYGTGEKPKFYGSDKNYAYESYWTETSEGSNIWKTNETFDSSVGFLHFTDSNGRESYSHKVTAATSSNISEKLTENLQFTLGAYNYAPVYLYYDGGNPGSAFETIEIAPAYSIFVADYKNNVKIDNICLKYAGWHGMKFNNVEDIEVTNCEIGWIGGAGGSASSNTRWGNGIEFWESCDNVLVDHCYVYQIYDAGLTNQWDKETGSIVVEQNIQYTNNLIEYCTYAYEFFINQSNSNNRAIMRDISFNENICRYTGYGWGQENRTTKNAASDIKGWDSVNRTENVVIENNMFSSSRFNNVHFGSYGYNTATGTGSYENMIPQNLIKLIGNTYVNPYGRQAFNQLNRVAYNADYTVNRELIKDGFDSTGRIVLFGINNMIEDSSCDSLDNWSSSNSSATLSVLQETEPMFNTSGTVTNSYIALSDRASYSDSIDQIGLADKFNENEVKTYKLTGRVKLEDTSNSSSCVVSLSAPSYADVYTPYILSAQIDDITDEWKYFSLVFDTSDFQFATLPSDTVISFSESEASFTPGSKLCIDDICLVPIDTKHNIIKNSTMDLTTDWVKSNGTSASVTLTFETETNGNKYLKFAGRTADWLGIKQDITASELKPGKTYIFNALAKIENDTTDEGAIEVYLLSKTNSTYKVYKKLSGIGDDWKNISFEFTLSNDEVPSDVRLEFRAVTKSIDGGDPSTYNLCLDNVSIVRKN